MLNSSSGKIVVRDLAMFWCYFDQEELILFIKGNFLELQHMGSVFLCIFNGDSL